MEGSKAAHLDPMLVDPDAATKERIEGTTSDAATRDADVRAADVPPDPDSSGNKASDSGPERYPFPPGGDVDIATVDPGSGSGEYFPELSAEDWVVLDGDHDEVPDSLDGRRAAVLEVTYTPDPPVKWSQRGKIRVLVRTRDEYNATLEIPLAATKEIQRGGLDHTVRG